MRASQRMHPVIGSFIRVSIIETLTVQKDDLILKLKSYKRYSTSIVSLQSQPLDARDLPYSKLSSETLERATRKKV
jgi:hypothetical protein